MIQQMIWVRMKILMMRMIHSKIAIIITAAGSSTRIGGGIKKEYLPYKNGTVLSVCAETFLNACCDLFEITDFIVTCPVGGVEKCREALGYVDCHAASQLAMTGEALKLAMTGEGTQRTMADEVSQCELTIVEGAETRQKSVYNGLLAVKGNPDIVLIHDGARPFVTKELIVEAVQAAIEHGASVPGITPTDTQKEIDRDGFIVRHLVRSSLTAVQTPQCFDFKKLVEAHKKAKDDGREYTDDTEIWGQYCGRVRVIKGDVNNIKITYPADLEKIDYRVKPDNDMSADDGMSAKRCHPELVSGSDYEISEQVRNDLDSEEEPDDSSWAWL